MAVESIDYCKLHDLKKMDPLGRVRLAPILDNSYIRWKTCTDDLKIRDHELKAKDLILRSDLISGYDGYIPRKCYYYGKSHVPECKSCLAEFVDFQKVSSDTKYDPPFVFPDKKLLPDELKVPSPRPYQLNPNINVPSHITPPMKQVGDGKALTQMGDLNPEKTHILRYTGYIPGKKYSIGTTCAVAANNGFINMSSQLRELNLQNERPSAAHWYIARALRPPEKLRLLKNYHLETPRKIEPPFDYGGFIPGLSRASAISYGPYSNRFFNERDLKYSTHVDQEAGK